MKKILFTLALTAACQLLAAQETVPFTDTFETEGAGDLWLSQEPNLVTAEVTENPLKSGANTSDKVLKIVKVDTQWPGVQRRLTEKLNFGPVEDEQYAFIHFKIKNDADTELRFKFYCGSVEYVYDYPVNANTDWTELCVFVGEITDYEGNMIDCDIDKILIRPNVAGTIYVDDIYVSKTQDAAPLLTGIKEIQHENDMKTGIYGIDGVKTNNSFNHTGSGIYIVNGKKVIKQ